MIQRACFRFHLALWSAALSCLIACGQVRAGEAKFPDPAKGTHRQVAEISFKNASSLRHFCVTADGKIIGLVGPAQTYGANAPAAGGTTELRICDAEGKEIKSIPVAFAAQAVTTAPDGSIWVAGSGKIARIDSTGKATLSQDSPHVAEVVKDMDKLRKQAAENLEEEKQSYREALKQMQDMVKELQEKIKAQNKTEKTEKQDEEKTKPAKRVVASAQNVEVNARTMLPQYEQMVKSYEQMLKTLEKKTVDQKVAEIKSQLSDIRCIAVSDQDVFITTRMVKGYGFAVWRMGHDLNEPKQIVGNLSGCCGQMDVECCKGCIFVAENSRKRVSKYDREGKLIAHFGKDARADAVSGFGSCCNPMNVAFNAQGDVFTSESDGQVKRFSPDGKFIEFVGLAKVQPGCKNSAIGLSPDGEKIYYIDSQKAKIIVLAREGTPARTASK